MSTNKLGELSCSENTRNTGFGSCFEDWKQIVGAFIFDSPKTFTKSDIASLQATLITAASLDDKTKRMYPVHGFVAPTDSSEKVIIETFDYGAKAIVRDGDIDWLFQFVDGGNCLNKALRSHNGKRWVVFYDKENKLLGYDLSSGLAAIPMHFIYAHPWGLATGSKTATYMLEFSFLPKYVNELRQFVKSSFDLDEISGLMDIDILVNTWNQSTGVANVTFQNACGAENVYDTYHTQLVASLFTAYDSDGNAVTITAMAPAAGKTFNVSLNTSQLPDDGSVTLAGKAVSVLVAAGIIGYEIGKASLTIVDSD